MLDQFPRADMNGIRRLFELADTPHTRAFAEVVGSGMAEVFVTDQIPHPGQYLNGSLSYGKGVIFVQPGQEDNISILAHEFTHLRQEAQVLSSGRNIPMGVAEEKAFRVGRAAKFGQLANMGAEGRDYADLMKAVEPNWKASEVVLENYSTGDLFGSMRSRSLPIVDFIKGSNWASKAASCVSRAAKVLTSQTSGFSMDAFGVGAALNASPVEAANQLRQMEQTYKSLPPIVRNFYGLANAPTAAALHTQADRLKSIY
jgi:hypothetical protein